MLQAAGPVQFVFTPEMSDPVFQFFDAFAYVNGVFVAVGAKGNEQSDIWCSFIGYDDYNIRRVLTSTNGVSLFGTAFGNGFIILATEGSSAQYILTSSNGSSWNCTLWPSRYFFSAAVWGPLNGGTFAIAVGEYYNPYAAFRRGAPAAPAFPGLPGRV